MTDRFLRACRRQPVDRTPIWIMRQAGRYLPEYRELRARVDFLESVPHAGARRRGHAAAVAAVPAGCGDPVFGHPAAARRVRHRRWRFRPARKSPSRCARCAQVEALQARPAAEAVPFVADAIRILRRELDGKTPLIGFCGAPFTLAAYLVQGEGKEGFGAIKRLMYHEPATLEALLEKLAQAMIDYLRLQIEAGVQAVQISIRGRAFSAAPTTCALPCRPCSRSSTGVRDLGVPIIYFINGAPHLIEAAASAGADVLGLCWRTSLDEAAARVAPEVALQGNLDPHVLFAEPRAIRERATDVLRPRRGPAGPHHEPRARHSAGHPDRVGRDADRGRSRRSEACAVRDLIEPSSTLALLERYDRPGPRYTSYPTAVEFHDGVRDEQLPPSGWHALTPTRDGRCRSTCTCRSARSAAPFCGCNVVITRHRDVAARYLDAPRAGDRSAGGATCRDRRAIAQIHWGGGTPTYSERRSARRGSSTAIAPPLHVQAGRRARRSRSIRASPRAAQLRALARARVQPHLDGRAGLRPRRCRRRSTACRATS